MPVLELVGFGPVGFELVDFEPEVVGPAGFEPVGLEPVGFVLAGLVMGFFFKGRGELLLVDEALVWAEELLAWLLAVFWAVEPDPASGAFGLLELWTAGLAFGLFWLWTMELWTADLAFGLLAGEEAFFASLLSFPRRRESLRVSAFLSFFVMFYLPCLSNAHLQFPTRLGTMSLTIRGGSCVNFVPADPAAMPIMGITAENGRINKKSPKRAFFGSLNLKKDLQMDIQGLRQDIRTIQHALMKRKPAGYTNEK